MIRTTNQELLLLNLLILALVIFSPLGSAQAQVLPVATFFGGSNLDGWYDVPIVEAADGTIYVAGATLSNDLPISDGCFDPSANGGYDIFVAHFDAGMTQLLHATYLGGSGADAVWPGLDMLLAADGTVYVATASNSTDYPTTTGAFCTTPGGSYDVVITRLSSDLTQVEASTYLGGSNIDDFPKLDLHPSGDILVTCGTVSYNFPTTAGAFREVLRGGKDLAIARLTADLTTLVAGTYLGSSGNDWPEAIENYGSDEIFLTGWTRSTAFPTTDGAFMEHGAYGTYHAFVSCLSSDLTTLVAGTYINGNNWEFGYGLLLDETGSVYACGHTASTDFPGTSGGAQPTYAGSSGAGAGDDMWIARFSHDLTTLTAATYLGGADWENAVNMVLVPDGIIVGGTTSSQDFPVTAEAFNPLPNGGSSNYTQSMTLTKLNRDLTVIEASTYLGGNSFDNLGDLYLTAGGKLLIGGSTGSADFPVATSAFAPTFSGGSFEYGGDVVLACLDIGLTGEMASAASEAPPKGIIQLQGAIPNPFNPHTEVAFSVSKPGPVKVAVHNLAGHHIITLANRDFTEGTHRVAWAGRDRAGRAVSSGTYLVNVTSGLENKSMKLLLGK